MLPASRLITRRSATSTKARSMKPAPFEYVRPAHLDEACALLAAGDDVRIIAGGQTLVPMMAMRLARPTRLIDIARIPELAFVRDEGERRRRRRHHPAMRARARPDRRAPRCRCSPRSCRSSGMRRPARAAPSAARSPMPIRRPRSRWSRSRSARRWSIAKAPTAREIAGRGFLHRADDDGAARGRLPHRGPLSGLARGAHRRRLPRGQRAPQRLRLRRRRPRRSRSTRTAAAGASRSASARVTPCRCGSTRSRERSSATRLDDATVRDAVARRARRHRADVATCTHRPAIAAAPRRRSPCARSSMPTEPPRGAHARLSLPSTGSRARSRSSRA